MTNTEEAKNHPSAADVILPAAKQSGLLEAVAEAMCFIDKHLSDNPGLSMTTFACPQS
jgi:hypothetical protein